MRRSSHLASHLADHIVRFAVAVFVATGSLLVLAPLQARAASVADVAVVVADHPDPVVVKTNLVYLISVTNVGTPTNTAAAVTLHDQLSLTQTYVSSHTPVGTCTFSAGSFDCSLGDMAPRVTVIVKLVVKEMGSLQDSTAVSVSTSSSDPIPANNQARALTQVVKAPKPHKSPKPSVSPSASTSESPTIAIPPPASTSSATLPIMGSILAAGLFILLAGFFAWREHRTP